MRLRCQQVLAAFLPLLLSFTQTEANDGFVTPASTILELRPLFSTDTAKYTLSNKPFDAHTAQQICNHHGGDLLSVFSPEELQTLQSHLPPASFWSSGISFSNSTTDNILLWSSSQQPFPFPVANRDLDHYDDSPLSRDRRSPHEPTTTCCPCPTTLPPFTLPPCKKPQCQVTRPPCNDVPRDCTVCGPAECSAQRKDCWVECKEKCRIKKQPVCTVVDSDKPRCHLENPNPIDCKIEHAACKIVEPGRCTAKAVECSQTNPDCEYKIKPCKLPCSKQDCTTVTPPCVTTKHPCVTTQVTCAPPTPSPDCLKRCRRSFSEKGPQYDCIQKCQPVLPPECGQSTTVCPPDTTTCGPPATVCTTPFVDCSPIFCESSVKICKPPEVHCPVPEVECSEPKIDCQVPVPVCPDPEVICDYPEITCSKPEVECPDAIVHCSPIVTNCGRPPIQCNDSRVDCPDPIIHCQNPVTCPIGPPTEAPPEGTPPPSSCRSCGACSQSRGRRDVDTDDEENVERIECIALSTRNDGQEAEWVAQNCNLKHRFICKT